ARRSAARPATDTCTLPLHDALPICQRQQCAVIGSYHLAAVPEVEVAVPDMDVAVADAAMLHPDQHLAPLGIGQGGFAGLQRLAKLGNLVAAQHRRSSSVGFGHW